MVVLDDYRGLLKVIQLGILVLLTVMTLWDSFGLGKCWVFWIFLRVGWLVRDLLMLMSQQGD